MPELPYDALFERRLKTKQEDFRDFLQKAEEVRRSMPPSYDRDTAMIEIMGGLLRGGKTLKGAHSESLDKIADFVRRHAPKHAHTKGLGTTAREISAYHYSRMR
jgi:hypothetical protein